MTPKAVPLPAGIGPNASCEVLYRETSRLLADLAGHPTLEGLYRVLSFLGLGVSLVIVSLVYQRFLSSKSVAARAAHEGEP